MSYGLAEYGGAMYGGGRHGDAPAGDDLRPALAVEVAFTTGALEPPVWEDITPDVRWWDTNRGRNRELERYQPGRATVVLSNKNRQYDSANAAGPHAGNLKPMRRMRIRETFNGVTYPTFDGFVDQWLLDYPLNGKDATATVIATDGFKIHARTDLPRSVYTDVVGDDEPEVWLRLDDVQTIVDTSNLVLNHGSNPFDATTTSSAGEQQFGAQGLITHDPGDSVEFFERVDENIVTPYALDQGPFSVECWFRLSGVPTATEIFWEASGIGSSHLSLQLNPSTMKLGFVFTNSAGGAFSAQPNTVINVGQRYHVVCVHDDARLLGIWINGVLDGTGVRDTTTGTLTIDALWVGSSGTGASPLGTVGELATYDEALTATQIAEHYAAGATPWQGDLPGARIDRVLDMVGWPVDLREVDDGDQTLQSAALGTTALEHLQKVGETEFGLLFMSADGKVRFVDRAAVFARTPGPAIFGDDTDEVGYRSITFDDGDTVIRDRATISRLNGVAQTDEDAASVAEFGRFDYTLDGLLHDTDAYSADYASFIVAEYKDPRRRVTSLELGPAEPATAAALYPQMLGRQLGEAITVRNRPPGGGDPFEQVCVIEGIQHSSQVGRNRMTTWVLSPEMAGSF